jgi:hypothetical protein
VIWACGVDAEDFLLISLLLATLILFAIAYWASVGYVYASVLAAALR